MMKTVLMIAGSDPGAGAGLQQDLKVATLLGTYGLTVVTAVTVQNSRGVSAVHPLPPEVVAAQLEAVLSDFPIAAVKIGMLANGGIVRAVAGQLRCLKEVPLVLDPVLGAGGGFPLLDADGSAALQHELFPLTHLLTPNAPEAARLTGLDIQTPADLEEAARRLQQLGPRWVLAKGGHLTGDPIDILTDGKNAYQLGGPRLAAPHNHGSGCALAAACAAALAQGAALPEAVSQARALVRQALQFGLPLGGGSGPVNPYAPFARDLARFQVLADLQAAAARLAAAGFTELLPEVQANLGYAAPYPRGVEDVAAFPGRLVKSPHGLLIPAPPEFGASRHIAAIILTALQTHPHLRCALNLKLFDRVEEIALLLHLRTASFDRTQEPADIKSREGSTLAWGVASVLQPDTPPPDLIYDKGDWGKEPMVRILGTSPMNVVAKALALQNALQVAGGK
jgi:hydroxymethylpyrimidine kinase / phosphomethylpyrimidine kinase / thiamine-phosphate diphosphorylase